MLAIETELAPRLLAWFDRHGRHDLPWQHPRTPYRVWLSEIMLQQTQVSVVIPYFQRFIDALPDLPSLAHAPQDDVLALWSGLGYYARARNLHAAAKRCVELHDGDLPRDLDALIALPGIGRSTAGAILSQAWGDAAPILDGNVKRVLCRLSGIDGWPGLPKVEKQLWGIAETLLPAARLADYTQAQMDFGATLCTRSDPACAICPLQEHCIALREGRVGELPSPKPGKPLPEHADLVAARTWFDARAHGDFDAAQAGDPIAHGFSHYRLRIHPHRLKGVRPRHAVGDNDDLRWATRAELAGIGLPAPVRRLLQAPDEKE